MRKILAFLLVIALLLPAAAFAEQESGNDSFALDAGGESPEYTTRAVTTEPFAGGDTAEPLNFAPSTAEVADFSFTDTDNKVHRLSDYADKYLVIFYGTIGNSGVKSTLANMQRVLELTEYDSIVAIYFDGNSTQTVTPAQFAAEFSKLGLSRIIASANDGNHMARAKQWYNSCLGTETFPGANNPISFVLELKEDKSTIRYFSDGAQSFDELASPLGKLVGCDVVGRPLMLKAEAEGTALRLSWDSYGEADFVLERAAVNFSSTDELNVGEYAAVAPQPDTNSYLDTSIAVNAAYLYRVKAAGSEYSTPAYARLRVSTATEQSAALAQEAEYIMDLRRFDEGAGLLLRGNAALDDAAQERAEECELLRDHYRPDGSWWTSVLSDRGIKYSKNVEFVGAANSAAELVENWFRNQNNLEYLLSGNYNCMGSGCYTSKTGTTYYCVIFLKLEDAGGMRLPVNPYVSVKAEPASLTVGGETRLSISGAENYELSINGEPHYSGTGIEFMFTPPAAGNYRIELDGTDRAGMKGEASISLEVLPVYHSVKYMVNGELAFEYSVEDGKCLDSIPAVPEKEGFNAAWDKELAGVAITQDVTVNAVYSIRVYSVKYMVGGELYREFNVEHGMNLTEPPDVPQKEGFNAAWDKELAGVAITQDVTVNAVYSIRVYSVKYMLGGELYREYSVEHGKCLTEIPNVPKKEGQEGAWDINLAGIAITSDYTINAFYTDRICTVEFWVEGRLYKSINLIAGDALSEIPAVPEKEGFNAAWDKELAGVAITQHVTVNAVYTPVACRVEFMVNDKLYKSYSVKYGETLDVIPTVPAKEGFNGRWNPDLAGAAITQDTVVNAVYTIKTYSIYYIIGDMVYRMFVVEHGMVLTEIPEFPDKEGYTGAWSADLRDVQITEEYFVFAVYEKKPHYGDADCSTIITAADAAAILRHLVELDTLSEQGIRNADCDLNGVITAADAACILRYLVELEHSLPLAK